MVDQVDVGAEPLMTTVCIQLQGCSPSNRLPAADSAWHAHVLMSRGKRKGSSKGTLEGRLHMHELFYQT